MRRAVLAMHEVAIERFGGSHGLRDGGLLDSALARPMQVWQYTGAPIFTLAAVYAHGIAKNHAFIDGNKRAAFLVASAFLELNGLDFIGSEDDTVSMTFALAAGEADVGQYAAWLERSAVPHPH